jgi:hypothetical protein
VTEQEYCREVCGAKCCHLRLPDEGEPIACPHLKSDNACAVYNVRYAEGADDLVVVGYWQSRRYKTLLGQPAERPFWCGRILKLHAAGMIPPEVAQGCCVIHPALLSPLEET